MTTFTITRPEAPTVTLGTTGDDIARSTTNCQTGDRLRSGSVCAIFDHATFVTEFVLVGVNTVIVDLIQAGDTMMVIRL